MGDLSVCSRGSQLSVQQEKRKSVNLVHVHDSQTFLVPKLIISRHAEEHARGETPAIVATFHNNAEPMEYEIKNGSSQYLENIGLEKRIRIPSLKGLSMQIR